MRQMIWTGRIARRKGGTASSRNSGVCGPLARQLPSKPFRTAIAARTASIMCGASPAPPGPFLRFRVNLVSLVIITPDGPSGREHPTPYHGPGGKGTRYMPVLGGVLAAGAIIDV